MSTLMSDEKPKTETQILRDVIQKALTCGYQIDSNIVTLLENAIKEADAAKKGFILKKKPTIAELEAILDSPGKIEVLPSGEVRVTEREYKEKTEIKKKQYPGPHNLEGRGMP